MNGRSRRGFAVAAVGCLLVVIFNSGGRESRVGTVAGCALILLGLVRLWRGRSAA